ADWESAAGAVPGCQASPEARYCGNRPTNSVKAKRHAVMIRHGTRGTRQRLLVTMLEILQSGE
ncbi:MAG: hypothetical protein M0T85_04070, partial [Dehalococcoidales bacterium]|nr:hypothetical protein [Dehalococcoidales bacterium]